MSKRTALLLVVMSAGAFALAGCKDDHTHDPKPAATQPGGAASEEDHPNQVKLGETTASGLKLVAFQDEPVEAGGEGAFDLQITGYPEGGKPKSVRFWVGNESGTGSVKALAEEEKPDTWHSHAEVPDPIPADAKFWAEVEPASGEKFKVSFDLKK